jgi:uncharacterized membrane protein
MTFITTRPRLFAALATGVAAAALTPDLSSLVTRVLAGWNVGTWTYLVLIGVFMLRADHGELRRVAAAHAESASVVLTIVVLAALTSLAAIVYELSAAKLPGSRHALPHVLLTLSTVLTSWVLLPTLFTLTYASLYYRDEAGTGLRFPEADSDFKPDYSDFAYFSFTIAVAMQTADVVVTTKPMRRLVLLHALLSFVFNTTILAFTINIAASLF